MVDVGHYGVEHLQSLNNTLDFTLFGILPILDLYYNYPSRGIQLVNLYICK